MRAEVVHARQAEKGIVWTSVHALIFEPGCRDVEYRAPIQVAVEHAVYTEPNPATGEGLEVVNVYDNYESGQLSSDATFTGASNNSSGRLTATYDRGSHTRFNYDYRGAVRKVSRRVAKPADFVSQSGDGYSQHWHTVRADFDRAGRPTRRTTGAELGELLVSGKSEISFQYTLRGTLSAIGSSYGALVSSMGIAADGLPTFVTYGDRAATTASNTYDQRRRLQNYTISRSAPSLWTTASANYTIPGSATTQTILTNTTLTYDLVGNPKTINDGSTSSWPVGAKPVATKTLGYDDQYRVRSSQATYSAAGQVSPFSHEANAGDDSPVPLRTTSTRVASQTFDFDFMGNITFNDDDQHLNYDRSFGTASYAAGTNMLASADGIDVSYDEAGNTKSLRVERSAACPDGAGDACSQWFEYDWDEIGQLARARRWDYNTSPPISTPTASSNWNLAFAYSGGARVLKTTIDSAGVEDFTLEIFDSLRLEHTDVTVQAWTPCAIEESLIHCAHEADGGLVGEGGGGARRDGRHGRSRMAAWRAHGNADLVAIGTS